MSNFVVLEKGLGIVSPPDFGYDFSRKIFLMLHSINWPNFIVWLPLLLEVLGNMCIAINFEINSYLSSQACFSGMTKNSGQKYEYEKKGETISIFQHF